MTASRVRMVCIPPPPRGPHACRAPNSVCLRTLSPPPPWTGRMGWDVLGWLMNEWTRAMNLRCACMLCGTALEWS